MRGPHRQQPARAGEHAGLRGVDPGDIERFGLAADFEPAALAQIAGTIGFDATAAASVPDALQALARAAPGDKRVLICGSLYLAGEVLALQERTGER